MATNAYEKHEELIKMIEQLCEKYGFESMLKITSDLKIDSESLLRIITGVQGIHSELGKRIKLLWQIKLGKAQVPVIKADLKEARISVLETENQYLEVFKNENLKLKDENLKVKDEIVTLRHTLEEIKKLLI